MKEDRFPELPRFKMYNEFFAGLGNDFEPVALGRQEKKGLIREISQIEGHPNHEFRQLREDLALSAQVREVRRYADGKMYVRFEFRRMESNCDWSIPYQMLAMFDGSGKLESYTVVRSRDVKGEKFTYLITYQKYNWDRVFTARDADHALKDLDSEPDAEVAVRNPKTGEYFVYLYAGMGDDKRHFDVEWYAGPNPWLFALTGVDLATVRAVLDTLTERGERGLASEFDWRVFDYKSNYSRCGVNFEIDAELKRALLFARRRKDRLLEATVLALGIGDEPVSDGYVIRVAPGSEQAMLNAVFNKTLADDISDTNKSKLFAYLAIRGDRASMNNLGYHFHFGGGVEVDYDLAEYWHLKGAEKGDAYCMLSLGKIYSEKDGPKWNGSLAVKWFEKAARRGDNWAKGELAHCILCGKCVERDLARAEDLLSAAVAACPDREDFVRDLKRVQSGEEVA